jgi:hypothetical protein
MESEDSPEVLASQEVKENLVLLEKEDLRDIVVSQDSLD